MITGDNGVTASAIARQIGMPNAESIITGNMIEEMDDQALQQSVQTVSIFSRVMPAHKMRIVKAFQANGEVVAMTGDGVNDAAALKYADIGISMGKRGSEVSREASDIILMDDRFTTIVDTIRDGRRIYDNIKKAIGYVFTIHIPIALASLIAPILKIPSSDLLLLPLHVMLMELVIDPTCSIVLERQPAEQDIMDRKARNKNESLIQRGMVLKSVIQGLVIFAASFSLYYIMWRNNPGNAPLARTYGFVALMLANLFLVQIISSNVDPVLTTFRTLMRDKLIRWIHVITIAALLLILYTPLSGFMKLAPLPFSQFLLIAVIAAASVFWYEIVKVVRKWRKGSAEGNAIRP
jgi:Ca2+-transporting ATPase